MQTRTTPEDPRTTTIPVPPERGAPGGRPGNGHGGPAEAAAAERRGPAAEPSGGPAPAPKRKRRRLLLLIPILLLVGAIAATVGYRYWYESAHFVMTDNAMVTGDMVQIGSLNAGRIYATDVDVGDQIQKGQEIAVIAVPQQIGVVPNSGTPVLGETGNSDTRVPVRAPLSGVVVARMGFVGATVAAGQPIYALVDPTQVYVRANIEETKIARVQPGQSVEVHVDALDRTFPGRVEAITPASAATFSLLPSQNVAGNFTKVTQLVPVKISVDSGGELLPLGTSVEVKISVPNDGRLPWQR